MTEPYRGFDRDAKTVRRLLHEHVPSAFGRVNEAKVARDNAIKRGIVVQSIRMRMKREPNSLVTCWNCKIERRENLDNCPFCNADPVPF